MSEKKKNNPKQKPVHIIRHGEAVASIYPMQSNSGYTYYALKITHCWTNMTTGKEAHSDSFFPKHEEDIILCVREAAAWIRLRLQEDLSTQEMDSTDDTPRAEISSP
jgi:hypothetical protein